MPDLFDQSVEYLKTSVEHIGRAFTKPNDDWAPFAHLISKKGTAIMPLSFENDEEKDVNARAVAFAAVQLNAPVVGFVFSAWMVKITEAEYDPKNLPRPSRDNRREEVVIISVIEATRSVTVYAPIIRKEQGPPTLGEWSSLGNAGSGRFIDMVQRVLILKAHNTTKQN